VLKEGEIFLIKVKTLQH